MSLLTVEVVRYQVGGPVSRRDAATVRDRLVQIVVTIVDLEAEPA